MSKLLNALREAERAEQLAEQLRRELGSDAERFCEAHQSDLSRRDANWRFWEEVKRSLRWVRA